LVQVVVTILLLHAVVATSPLRGCGVEEPDIPLLAVHRRDGRSCHGIEAEHGPARNGGRERDMFLVPRVDKKHYLAGDGTVSRGLNDTLPTLGPVRNTSFPRNANPNAKPKPDPTLPLLPFRI
jgi:hypothetical protein